MLCGVEYPSAVNRALSDRPCWRFAALIPAFTLIATFAGYGMAYAQVSGPAAHINIPPPTAGRYAPPTGTVAPRTGSVAPPTSIMAGFAAPNSSFPGRNFSHRRAQSSDHNHRTTRNNVAYPIFYGVPVPYEHEAGDDDLAGGQSGDAESQQITDALDLERTHEADGGPYYGDPMRPGDADSENLYRKAVDGPENEQTEIQQPPTTLVFKDGHQLEVENYAILGQTLYDLTPGHPRRVALADLDLAATQKQNDDRGVVFQLPPSGN